MPPDVSAVSASGVNRFSDSESDGEDGEVAGGKDEGHAVPDKKTKATNTFDADGVAGWDGSWDITLIGRFWKAGRAKFMYLAIQCAA